MKISFDVITIFPELIDAFAKESLLQKAQQKKLLAINAHNLRKWAIDAHRTVDDEPYGGGLGMVLKVEPIFKAVAQLKKGKEKNRHVILFSPRGGKFTQNKAFELTQYDQLIFICGRYEGVDERVAKYIADETLSIGDFDLMGGEIPAMAVIEATARLIPGVVGKPEFLEEHTLPTSKGKGFIEYPQYTRPEVFQASRGEEWKVPSLLTSGDHKKIEEWRKKHGKIIR